MLNTVARAVGVPLDWHSHVRVYRYRGKDGISGTIHALRSVDNRRILRLFVPSVETYQHGGVARGLDHSTLITSLPSTASCCPRADLSASADEDVIGGASMRAGRPALFDASMQWRCESLSLLGVPGGGEILSDVLGRNAIVELARHAVSLAVACMVPSGIDARGMSLALLRR